MNSAVKVLISQGDANLTSVLAERYGAQLANFHGKLAWPALWIAVNHDAVAAVRDRLAEAGKAVLGPGVMTFDNFAEAVLVRSGRKVQAITNLQSRRLLRRIIQSHLRDGHLTYFAPVAETEGFVSQLTQLIADLKERYVWPEQFAGRHGSPRGSGARHRELSGIYAAYQRHLLAGQLYDRQGRFWAAGDELAAKRSLLGEIGLLVVDGFTDFTVAQQRILQQLAPRCRETMITLPLDADLIAEKDEPLGRRELFAKTLETLSELRRDFEVGLDIADGNANISNPAWPAMRHLAGELFRTHFDGSAPTPPSSDGLQMIEASSDDDEARRVARAVKQLLTDGCPAEDVVVARRDVVTAADRLRGVFDDYGVPIHIAAKARLNATPLVRSLLGCLRLHVRDWAYRDLLSVVNDRNVDCPDDGRVAAEVCVRRAQIPRGRRRLLELMRHWAEGEDASVAQKATAALSVVGRLAAAFDVLPGRAAIDQWTTPVAAMAEQLGLALANDPAWLAWQRGVASLGQIESWRQFAIAEVDAAGFLDVAIAVAKEVELPSTEPPVGHVRIVSTEAVRGIRMRHLFLMGLGEKSFPAASRSDVLYSDAELERLMASSPFRRTPRIGAGSGKSEEFGSDEMLLFYQLVTRPTESLTLSYPALDAKAQRLEPSPYLVDLQRTFAGVETKETPLALEPGAAVDRPLSRTEQRLTAVEWAKRGQCEPLAEVVADASLSATGRSMVAGIEVIADRAHRDRFGPWEGMFTTSAAAEHLTQKYGPDHLWSPSQLESYAACPFRFVAEQSLHLEPLPDLVLESDARRRGSLMHQALAEVHRALLAATDEPARAALVERFAASLEAIVAARPLHGLEAALREIQRRELVEWGAALDEQAERYATKYQGLDDPLRPRYFEVRFGPGSRESEDVADAELSTDQPFAVDLGDEHILITGQVDRIDVGQLGGAEVFNVIDYKSSKSAKLDSAKVESGRQLQLPLYAMAAEEMLLADRNALAWEAGYWSVAGDGFTKYSRNKLTNQLQFRASADGTPEVTEHWRELRTALLARIREVVDSVRAAAFPVYNDDENCTTYCELSKLCRIGHIRSLEKTWPAWPEETRDDVTSRPPRPAGEGLGEG